MFGTNGNTYGMKLKTVISSHITRS